MSSGFPGDFYGAGGINTGRSTMNNNTLRSQLSGILPDPATQIVLGRSNLMGKRSLAEFQQQQQLQFLQQQQQQNQQQQMILQQQQQQQGLGFYLRNVKPRNYQQASPIDCSAAAAAASSISSEFSSFSSNSNASTMNTRHTHPVLQQLRSQPGLPLANTNISGFLHPGTQNYSTGVHNRATIGQELLSQESEKKMMNQLQELEKQLLDDNDDEDGDTVSVVTNNEWSETIQNLISPCQSQNQSQNQNQNQNQKLASLSPSSSTSSCASSTESPPISCPKQSITEVATAISEGINHVAVEILTRLSQVSNVRGSSTQRLTAYMVSALRSRVNPTDYPPPVLELHSKEHTVSTQNLYEVSPCFKLGFMAANLAILEAVTDHPTNKIHVIDFDVGQGGQYLHLLHALAAKKSEKPAVLKITAFTELVGGVDDRLNSIGVELKAVANKIGVCLYFNVMACKITDLSREKLRLEPDEALAVNFAFKLYRQPDESVTTENLRDELLRRVKGLSPKVVTVVEQELNGNTAPFLARVNEACGYYGALFDSLDATVPRDNLERVRIEEGLSRKMANSVACEGRDRVERCEVFGKWRARMSMAGFVQRPMSQLVANSLCSKLNSGTRGNPGFTVNEQSGGICFGWMGRTLTVASAWR